MRTKAKMKSRSHNSVHSVLGYSTRQPRGGGLDAAPQGLAGTQFFLRSPPSHSLQGPELVYMLSQDHTCSNSWAAERRGSARVRFQAQPAKATHLSCLHSTSRN